MMDFFEALRTRAFEDAEDFVLHELDCKHAPTGAEFASMGIDSTIEALKEMMVGEPLSGKVELHGGNAYVLTGSTPLGWRGIHVTDGVEEVVVMVFRDGK